MILPGHVAAAVLCHRRLGADKWAVLAASLAPDLIDKFLYYGLHVTPSSRLWMHTALAWLATTTLVATAEWALRRGGQWRWTVAWALGYGLHLLCDSPLTGGNLPFLYPFRAYLFDSPGRPWAFLFGLSAPPWQTLATEALLVAVAAYSEWRWRRAARRVDLGGTA
jgi:hypothetical protein